MSQRKITYPQADMQSIQTGLNIQYNKLVFVTTKIDLPAAVAGVITLVSGTTYFFTQNVDLTGDRLVCAGPVCITAGSSETATLSSTGLATALISSAYSLPMSNISITATVAIALDATANANQALDWNAVNFVDCPTVGTITSYGNIVFSVGSFLNSANLTFAGTINTIAFNSYLFSGRSGSPCVNIPATTTINRRFRVIYSAVPTVAGSTGFFVSPTAIANNETYILEAVTFSGAGTYIDGAFYGSAKTLFINNVGITNTGNESQYYMTGNATATTIAATNTYVKAAGATTSGAFIQRFTNTNNRATYNGVLTGFYKVTAIATLTSGNNQVLDVKIAKNGTVTNTRGQCTSNAGGRGENVIVQDVVTLSTNDYIEVFVANETAVTNITVIDLSVIVERLN